MTVLSNKQIVEERAAGNVIIEPFDERHVATSSYDVTLGDRFFREQSPDTFSVLYNPWNERNMRSVWGKAQRAQLAEEVPKESRLLDEEGVSPDDQVILIEPGETILAHTIEYIGGRGNITTMMKARSSIGRNFIEVCKCAGWGDVGYTNRWTMEITNNSRHYTIPLVVGRRIAQIIFFRTGEVDGVDYTHAGKYQETTNMEELKRSWNPEMMLPRLYKDREIKRG
jgi:dCTP deaminase